MWGVALCAALVAVLAAADNSVVVLTGENFKDELAKADLMLVKFYAPWCGHCKAMAESFIEAAEELKGIATLADLDATEHTELAKEFGIQGFPTLKFFVKGEVLKDYKGGRDKDAIVAGVKKALDPVYSTLGAAADVTKMLEDTSKIRMLFVEPKDAKVFKGITNSAEEMEAVMALVEKASTLPKLKLSLGANQVLVVPIGASADSSDAKVLDIAEDMLAALKAAVVPVWGELTMANARHYIESQPSLVALFVEKPLAEAKSEIAPMMEAAAKKLADKFPKFKFVYIVGEELKGFKTYMFGEDAEPKVPIAIYQFDGDAKFTWDDETKLSQSELESWVTKVASGELAPPLKSEPVPTEQAAPVYKIVGDSWGDVVEDKTKDVFIMQYAPWCGHCKKLHPTWDALAEKLKGEDTVIIAAMDATVNDAPPQYKAKGFPTLQFFPAGGDMVPYEGERTEEGFLAFIRQHAKSSHGIKDEL